MCEDGSFHTWEMNDINENQILVVIDFSSRSVILKQMDTNNCCNPLDLKTNWKAENHQKQDEQNSQLL